MAKEIKKVKVIGGGPMGRGIAGVLANAGLDVVLFDIDDAGAQKRMADAIENAKTTKNPADMIFTHPDNAKRITLAAIGRDNHLMGDADLVIEAVPEKTSIKHDAYRTILEHAPATAIITSNTSTLSTGQLLEGMPKELGRRFMNTHFFNPPRRLDLMELIQGQDTDREIAEQVREFCDKVLGKKVVDCKDAPGFIGNRIGLFLIERAKKEALAQGMSIADVDAILSKPFGFPSTGIFRLADLVGIDILQSVGENLHKNLAAGDEFNGIYDPAIATQLLADGRVGKKQNRDGEVKGGFYYEDKGPGGKKAFYGRDLKTGDYHPVQPSAYAKLAIKRGPDGYAQFFESDTAAAKFSWPVMRDTLLYVLNHAEEMGFDIQSIDEAMRAGYGWEAGPFQMLDKIGVKWFAAKLAEEGIPVPPLLEKVQARQFYAVNDKQLQVMDFNGAWNKIHRAEGVLSLSDIKLAAKPLLSHVSAKLWDIGDGVVCLEFTGPGNTLDPSVLHVLNEGLKLVKGSNGQYKAMVIYNEGKNFSPGANLGLLRAFDRAATEDLIFSGQAVFKAMREAPFPVIGAPRNIAVGGGCEILLHCDGIEAGSEFYTALVEVGVGLVPGWGGCARYLERTAQAPGKIKGPMPAFTRAVWALGMPDTSISSSAQFAKKNLWMRPDDRIVPNPERILADAKARALEMVPGYVPTKPAIFALPGASGAASIRMALDAMYLAASGTKPPNPVDIAVMERLVYVLSGGDAITDEEIDTHLASHHQQAHEILAHRGPGAVLEVNHTIPITEARILHLERQAFMAAVAAAETQARIAYMLKTKKTLREMRPDPAPDLKTIRGTMEKAATIRLRAPTGLPLEGEEGTRLLELAEITAAAYATPVPKAA